MRIVGIQESAGMIYRVYPSHDGIVPLLDELIPFFNETGCDVLVGCTDADPGCVLTIGPLDTVANADFRSRLKDRDVN